MTEVAVDVPFAFMHEQKSVAIGVAEQVTHRLRTAPDRHLTASIGEERNRAERIIGRFGGKHGIECSGPQRPFETGPTRRRMLVVDVAGRAEKPISTDLAL